MCRRRTRRCSAAARVASPASSGCPRGEARGRLHDPAALGRSRSAALATVAVGALAPGTLIAAGMSLLGHQWPAAPTTFVESHDAFTGRCSRAGGAHVLRIASAPGTPVPKASPIPEWGLHLVDVNIAQGDLVKVLRRQIRAYAGR